MDNTRKENWRPVKDFEGYYEISDKGNIRSLNFNNCKGCVKNLRPSFNRFTGYYSITLHKPGDRVGERIQRQALVHRLVAETFIPNPDNLPQVDHRDNCRTRNSVSNLRWVSRKQNNAKKHARQKKSQNHCTNKHDKELVMATNITTGVVRYYENGKQASIGIGCSHVLVYRCLNPNDYVQSARGWRLKYVPLQFDILPMVEEVV